jgi:hypothetical protein
MNSISWFIYIAQVSQSLGNLLIGFGAATITCCGFYTFARTLAASIDAETFVPHFPAARYVALGVLFLLIGNLMPERNTMYAIAASQVGERVAGSDAVQGITADATIALQQWIKRQIEPATKK